jgi:hypothetical protein
MLADRRGLIPVLLDGGEDEQDYFLDAASGTAIPAHSAAS